jgi:hypothetical protein
MLYLKGMKKTILFILIVVLATTLIVVALLVTKNRSIKNSRQLPTDKEIIKEIYGLAGNIKEIKDNTLTIETSVPLLDLTQGAIKTTLIMTVNDQTTISKIKIPTEILDKTKPIHPEEIMLKLADLKIGDEITISCAENIIENIQTDKPIIIKNIFVTE